MKKLLVIMGASLIALTVISADLLAAQGHGLNPYRTPEFVRNPAQMANNSDLLATAVYNPAGFTKFEDGIYVGLGNIFILKSNEMKVDTGAFGVQTYKQDEPSLLVPTFAVAYKTGKAAVFFNFEVIDGGGKVVYKDLGAVPGVTKGSKVEAESGWQQFKLGGSYDLTDMVSLTGGIRYIMADIKSKITNNNTGAVSSQTEESLEGQGGFFGINVTPVKEATINITYFTKATVYGEEKNKLTGVNDFAHDVVPSYFTIGFSYQVMPELEVSAGMNYVYTKEEKYGNQGEFLFVDQKNALEVALGADYKANELLTLSAGVAYKKAGGKSVTYDQPSEKLNPDLDLYVIGAGAKITPMAGLNVNAGVMKAFFKEGKSVDGKTKYNRDAWLFSLGVDYKI